MQQQPDKENRKSLPLDQQPQERGAQTLLTISDEDDLEPKIRVLRTCQTVIQIDYDANYETAITRLEYAPVKEILKEAIAIVDLPKKNTLQFNLDSDLQTTKASDENILVIGLQKTSIKKRGSSSNLQMIQKSDKIKKDGETQTNIRVSPHILNSEDVAIVIFDDNTQTDISCTPNNSNSNLMQDLITSNLKEEPSEEIINKKAEPLLSEDFDQSSKLTGTKEPESRIQKINENDILDTTENLNQNNALQITNQHPQVHTTSEPIILVTATNAKKTSKENVALKPAVKISPHVNYLEKSGEDLTTDDEDNYLENSIDSRNTQNSKPQKILSKKESLEQASMVNPLEVVTKSSTTSKIAEVVSNQSKIQPPEILELNIIYIPNIYEQLVPPHLHNSWNENITDSDLINPKISSIKTSSAVDLLDQPDTAQKIKNLLDLTVKSLEEMLGRMFETVNQKPTSKTANKCLQSNFFADHIPVIGDINTIKVPNIPCECQMCGPGGGAVPKLGPPPLKNKSSTSSRSLKSSQSSISDRILIENSITLCKICDNKKFGKSAPDLSEHHIRLLIIESKPCHCAKSDLLHKYAGFMAGKKISKSQNFGLLVDEDGEYTDSYLELLYHDQVGIQTEVDDFVSEEDLPPTQVPKPKKCSCDRNVEMPWDLITYKPFEKKDKVQIQEINEEVPQEEVEEEHICDEAIAIKPLYLTVTKIKEDDVIKLVRDRVGTLEIDDLSLNDVNIENDEVDTDVLQKIESQAKGIEEKAKVQEEEKPKKKSWDFPKPKPFQVYSPTCERHNEPYMDRMYTYFPDDCDLLDPCPSTVEMPWDKIILPKNCIIRKIYKPPKKSIKNDLRKICSHCNCVSKKQSNRDFDFKISFAELSSTIFKNDQIIKASFSNVTFQPRRSTMIDMVPSSFSQPDIKVKKRVRKDCKVPLGESREIKVQDYEVEKKRPRSKSPCRKNKIKHTKSRSERVANLLDSCKKEMAPIRDGINQLKARIKELNLPDYRELPRRTSFSYISSYSMLTPPVRPDLYPMPYWGSYFPYCPQYPIPAIPCPVYPSKRARSRSKSPSTCSTFSTDFCSEMEQFFPSCKRKDVEVCDSKNVPITSNKTPDLCKIVEAPKKCECTKKKSSKIPRLCLKKKISLIKVIPSSLVSNKNDPQSPDTPKVEDKDKCTLCTMEEKFIKACEAVNKKNLEAKSSVISITKITVRSKVKINLNKYRPVTVDKSSSFKGSKEDFDKGQKPDEKR